MEVANTLAYYDTATITVVKSFIVQAPGVDLTKTSFYLSLLKVFFVFINILNF
jgi:hypothetical protein